MEGGTLTDAICTLTKSWAATEKESIAKMPLSTHNLKIPGIARPQRCWVIELRSALFKAGFSRNILSPEDNRNWPHGWTLRVLKNGALQGGCAEMLNPAPVSLARG